MMTPVLAIDATKSVCKLHLPEVLSKVEPGHWTFLHDGSRFMYNNRIAHLNSSGLRMCRNIRPF